jgi:hypothetical protein
MDRRAKSLDGPFYFCEGKGWLLDVPEREASRRTEQECGIHVVIDLLVFITPVSTNELESFLGGIAGGFATGCSQ